MRSTKVLDFRLYLYKLKQFPQHFGGGHVMKVPYLHQHPFQIYIPSRGIFVSEKRDPIPLAPPLLVASYDKQRILWLNSITRAETPAAFPATGAYFDCKRYLVSAIIKLQVPSLITMGSLAVFNISIGMLV